MQNSIMDAINSPQDLEALHRSDPVSFKRCFPEVFAQNSDSLILRVWHQRLHFESSSPEKPEPSGWSSKEEWYFKYVAVYGLLASPLVATLLITRITGKKLRMASIAAKVFTPLFLLMVAVFLVAIVVLRKSPYQDRDFLIAFNLLLLAVLGLAVFSIAGRTPEQSRGLSDFMNLGLVGITLVLDVVALSAIVFRLTSYGFSPNRIAVLGANLLVFGHLLGLVIYTLRFVRGRGTLEKVERWITGYLPVYTAWSALVALAFPLLFGMK